MGIPTAILGHEDAFPPPRLSARCRFSQRTFAHGIVAKAKDTARALLEAQISNRCNRLGLYLWSDAEPVT